MLNVRKYELATFYANSEIYGCCQHFFCELVLAHLKAHFSRQGCMAQNVWTSSYIKIENHVKWLVKTSL